MPAFPVINDFSSPPFDFFSVKKFNVNAIQGANLLYIETLSSSDGWDTIETYQEFNDGWVTKTVNLQDRDVNGSLTVRFRVDNIDNDYSTTKNDLLVDIDESLEISSIIDSWLKIKN